VVLPTAALLASICAVAIAAVGFLISSAPNGGKPAVIRNAEQAMATATVTPTPTPTPTPSVTPTPHRRSPVVRKGATNVEVFNNSNVHGLAARTATRAQQAGWNVVGTDNWYGTVDAPTVYYPAKLKTAARALAADLGIARVRPAVAPMRLDRLTVILTGAYRP
jgi:hypothetical protein